MLSVDCLLFLRSVLWSCVRFAAHHHGEAHSLPRDVAYPLAAPVAQYPLARFGCVEHHGLDNVGECVVGLKSVSMGSLESIWAAQQSTVASCVKKVQNALL